MKIRTLAVMLLLTIFLIGSTGITSASTPSTNRIITTDTATSADMPPAPAAGNDYIGPRVISELVIHHSGSFQQPGYTAVQTVAGYRNYHMLSVHPGIYSDTSTWGNLPAQEGYPDGYSNGTGFNSNDIDYHFVIAGDGQVIVGRPLSTVGWNASNWESNLRNIGMCFIGNFDNVAPTTEAYQAGLKLAIDMCLTYQIYNINPHSAYAAKSCPGWDFPFAQLKTDILHGAGIYSDTFYADWFHEYLVEIAEHDKTIVQGYPDGSFQPQKEATRAEFVNVIWKASGSPVILNEVNFADTEGHWAEPAIQWAYQNHIIAGYGANIFAPDKLISRAEVAKILRVWKGLSDGVALGGYSDVPVSAWYATSIYIVTNKGLMNGYPDGTFKPDNSITRAEVAAIIARTLI